MQNKVNRYVDFATLDLSTLTVVNGTNCLKDSASLNYLDNTNLYLRDFTYTIIRYLFNDILYKRNIQIKNEDSDKYEKEVIKIITTQIILSLTQLST